MLFTTIGVPLVILLVGGLVQYLVIARPANQRALADRAASTVAQAKALDLQAQNIKLAGDALALQHQQTQFSSNEDLRKQAAFAWEEIPVLRTQIEALRAEVEGLRRDISTLKTTHADELTALALKLTTEHEDALAVIHKAHADALESQRLMYASAMALSRAEGEKPPEQRTQAAADAIDTMTKGPNGGTVPPLEAKEGKP